MIPTSAFFSNNSCPGGRDVGVGRSRVCRHVRIRSVRYAWGGVLNDEAGGIGIKNIPVCRSHRRRVGRCILVCPIRAHRTPRRAVGCTSPAWQGEGGGGGSAQNLRPRMNARRCCIVPRDECAAPLRCAERQHRPTPGPRRLHLRTLPCQSHPHPQPSQARESAVPPSSSPRSTAPLSPRRRHQ